jgi:LacI family transcriptional regulator
MASLKSIAQKANVTAATVSRALRGHTNVDPATAARIREVAAELGHTHNQRISNLMSSIRSSSKPGFHETLAFIWPDADAPEVSTTYQLKRFESGAVQRAHQLGFGMDVFYYDHKTKRPWLKLRKILQARGIRGIVWGPVLRSSHVRLPMPLETFATAGIGEAFVYPRLPHARFDHFVGMRTALHQLKRQGCRRIGFALALSFNMRASPIFIASFATSGMRGVMKPKELLHTPDVLTRDGLLAWALETKPDAILLGNDIPDLADLPQHPQITWPLKMASLNRLSKDLVFSGIDQRQDLIGSHACDLVIEQLSRNEFGVPPHPKIVMVEGEWQTLEN